MDHKETQTTIEVTLSVTLDTDPSIRLTEAWGHMQLPDGGKLDLCRGRNAVYLTRYSPGAIPHQVVVAMEDLAAAIMPLLRIERPSDDGGGENAGRVPDGGAAGDPVAGDRYVDDDAGAGRDPEGA